MKKALIIIMSVILLLQISVFAAAPIEYRHREHMTFFGKAFSDVSLNLMYHRISDVPEEQNVFTITTRDFENDIKYLISQGFVFKTASELARSGNLSKKGRIAVITFDDGYASDYTQALPILEKYNIKATFFVVGSLIDTDGYLTAEQLRKLSKSPLAEIGNHTYSIHAYEAEVMEDTYRRFPLEVIADYDKNAEVIKRFTGIEPQSVSYPYGVYTETVDTIFSKRGYARFCSKEYWSQDISLPYVRFNRAQRRSAAAIHDLLMQRIGK